MVIERLDTGPDITSRRKLSDLAYREGTSDGEMLRRLVDRAYDADLRAHVDTSKPPTTPPSEPIG